MSLDLINGKVFASFSHHLGYIDDDQLAIAFSVWLRDPTDSLLDLLVVRGVLNVRARAIVEQAAEADIAKYGGDVDACYAAICDKGWVPSVLLTDVVNSATDSGATIPIGKMEEARPVAGNDDATATISLGSYASGGSRYRLGRRIGKGGQGEVYEAVDTELNRDVLLKQVVAKYADDPESRGRFLRETRTGANLEHPGIVPVYDIGQHPGGQIFQVMRYFKPGSLHKKIASYHLAHPDTLEELSFRTLLGHFATACRAIDYAHSRGIHHLDIKPQNIVTGEFGETQIIDWGLAQVTDGDMREKVEEESGRLTGGSSRGSRGDSGREEAGSKPKRAVAIKRGFRGTPAYAAPEQWKGDWNAIGPQTDVYGLGATLYEILASKPPFQSSCPTIEEDVEIGNHHQAFKPWVPASLRAICLKAMSVKPVDRYISAGMIADDIERFLADEPVEAYPDPWQMQLWRFVKRRRTAVAAVTVLMATTAVALAIGNLLVSQQRDRAVAAEKLAIDQRNLATRNASMTREVIAKYIEQVADDEWGMIPGTGAMRLAAVHNVVEKFPAILAQQPENPELQYDAALIYRRCANLYRLLGKLDEATPLYDLSREIMRSLIKTQPDVLLYRLGWCHNLLEDAENFIRTTGPEAALPTLREALKNAEFSVSMFSKSTGALRTLAQVQMDLADVLVNSGRMDEAVRVSNEAVNNFDSITASDDVEDEEHRLETRLLAALATVIATTALTEADTLDEARAMSERAERQSAELLKVLGRNPNVDYVRAVAFVCRAQVLSRDAATATEGGKLEFEAVELLRELVSASPQETNFRPALSDALCDLAQSLLNAGNVADAATISDEAIAAVAPIDLPTGAAEAKRCLARAHAIRGRVSKAAGEATSASDHLRQALEYYEVATEAAPENNKLLKEADEIGRLLVE